MFLGWVGVETMWCHAPPKAIEAFLYYDDVLRHHMVLRLGTLFGQRHVGRELRALMKEPITYNEHEIHYANIWDIPLKDTLWEQPGRQAYWRRQCALPPLPAFHCGFINHAIRPLNGRTCVAGGAPLRPRHGLCHAPGHLRVRLLLPDVQGTCLCKEPWQLYAKCWQPRPDTTPPTMAQPAQWTMLGAWHGAQRVGYGEWWMCEGVV